MNKGYIAITSALIISILLMAIVFAVSASGYFAQANTVSALLKAEGRELADTCASMALLRLQENRDEYAGNQIVTIGAENCRILPIIEGGDGFIIKTTSNIQGAITNIQVRVRETDELEIISWGEVASF